MLDSRDLRSLRPCTIVQRLKRGVRRPRKGLTVLFSSKALCILCKGKKKKRKKGQTSLPQNFGKRLILPIMHKVLCRSLFSVQPNPNELIDPPHSSAQHPSEGESNLAPLHPHTSAATLASSLHPRKVSYALRPSSSAYGSLWVSPTATTVARDLSADSAALETWDTVTLSNAS